MIRDALRALREGQFILLYDFDEREGETDFAIRADAVGPAHVARMRRDGGGLICTAVHPDAARAMGLPFASDLLSRDPHLARLNGEVPYDRENRSSFSLWVNHRDTYTGITDRDRALTINAIAYHVKKSLNGGGADFFADFRSPGHVAILRAADGLLSRRRGQTELSIALAVMAGIPPAVTICEMLDDATGLALGKEPAREYARRNGLVFVEGREVLEAWDAYTRAKGRTGHS
ncbi:MAG: 3,4-dihydroxy-2-butanone-4-phosphate synthase [Methanolinea sp.]|nr:3,4-dihydroxy-2-butanone-4-phosphate synthase [Methanolinea sp.]